MTTPRPARLSSLLTFAATGCFVILSASIAAISPQTEPAANPIIPGDHPDPTILRIGRTYWMASTSGDWAPSFSIYRSTDLHHWSSAGAVFPAPPGWAEGDFWAPELVQAPDGVVVYYAARKKNGPLCVAAATAAGPEGPYTDHGPLVCQPDGSIDPSMVRDEHGRPFLIWKEDGNSVRKPTPIWAQPLTADLLHLTGTATQLITNDPDSWEGGVVEGPYILRHAGRFYLFYAGNACCGAECHYAEGVARADTLLGPWTKDPANPISHSNDAWKCPGHGTAVTTPAGKDYFLYHAYPAQGTVYLGRESVLDTIDWSVDDWPIINAGHGPSGNAAANPPAFLMKNFHNPTLDPEWKWPIGHRPSFQTGDGQLTIKAAGAMQPMYLARSLPASGYEATIAIPASSTAASGIGLIGETTRELTLFRFGSHVQLKRISRDSEETLAEANVASSATVWLRLVSSRAREVQYSYSTDNAHWNVLNYTSDTTAMLAWDHGLRIGLVAEGPVSAQACFRQFSLRATSANGAH
jgi:xylan 1,4-beta-xylosidase